MKRLPYELLPIIELERPFETAPQFLLCRSGTYWRNNGTDKPILLTAGAGGLDENDVKTRAIAELVEHSVARIRGHEYSGGVQKSFSDLDRESPSLVLNPLECSQLGPSSTRLVDPIGLEVPITWVHGRRLDGAGPALVPALVSFASWQPPAGEPLFIRTGGTGVAAHHDPQASIEHAVFEVIERDACMLSWRVPGWMTSALGDEWLHASLREVCDKTDLTVHMFDVGDPDLAPVVVSILTDQSGCRPTLGSAAGWNIEEACTRATNEALVLRWTTKHYCTAFQETRPQSSLEHVCAAYWRGQYVLRWYLAQSTKCDSRPGWATGNVIEKVASYCASSVFVELSDQKSRTAGWHVFRVVVPSCQPRESNSTLMHMVGRRLKSAHQKYSKGEPLHKEPHPFG